MKEISTEEIQQTVKALTPYMTQKLIDLVNAESLSGSEHEALKVMEQQLSEIGLTTEHLELDSDHIKDLPLYSPPCNPDNERYNLLAYYKPEAKTDKKGLLFNGHLDVVPIGEHSLWSEQPFHSYEKDQWIYGRGAGDMKGGLICVLTALKALQTLGVKPATLVAVNAVVDEEDTGNGSLASINALKKDNHAVNISDFDTVIIPEPFGETVMGSQIGMCWLTVKIIGKPAHVAYMTKGTNPIEAGIAVMDALKKVQNEWNKPENRYPAFADVDHPININLGTIQGGEWKSSVPSQCTLGIRCSFYPNMSADEAIAYFTDVIKKTCNALNDNLSVSVTNVGFKAPGCDFDIDNPNIQQLMSSHEAMHGATPEILACTATTDGRHFQLMTDLKTTVYGPVAKNIHGIDECVSVESMTRITETLIHYIINKCGVEAI